jgi:uncharacterized membrane protein (UPF0136 family)
MPAIVMTFVYGVLSIGGGIMGYTQAKSKASLISGVLSGLFLLLAGFGLQQGQSWGRGLAISITAVLIVVFLSRLFKTRKFMPAGLMVAIGIGNLIALLASLI